MCKTYHYKLYKDKHRNISEVDFLIDSSYNNIHIELDSIELNKLISREYIFDDYNIHIIEKFCDNEIISLNNWLYENPVTSGESILTKQLRKQTLVNIKRILDSFKRNKLFEKYILNYKYLYNSCESIINNNNFNHLIGDCKFMNFSLDYKLINQTYNNNHIKKIKKQQTKFDNHKTSSNISNRYIKDIKDIKDNITNNILSDLEVLCWSIIQDGSTINNRNSVILSKLKRKIKRYNLENKSNEIINTNKCCDIVSL